MTNITPHDYQSALDVQCACNLSGVVFSFSRIMERICEDGGSTEDRNTHAICRLFAEQIMHLSSAKSYHEAYDECERMSQVETTPS